MTKPSADLISMGDAMWEYNMSPHELQYLFMKGVLTRHPVPNDRAGPGVGVVDRTELEAFLRREGRLQHPESE